MTQRKYRSYTEEFKLQALALLEKYEKSAGQIERELALGGLSTPPPASPKWPFRRSDRGAPRRPFRGGAARRET